MANAAPETIRACHVSNLCRSVGVFFHGQFEYLRQYGFRYAVIANDPTSEWAFLPPDSEYFSVPVLRSITPWTDLKSIWRMWRIFRRGRFDMVQYTTPKGALLGSIAAFLARVPVRLYLFWGIYYVAQTGWKRRLFKFLEWLICRLSTRVTFDGAAIRQFAIDEGLCSAGKSDFVGQGGDNGIDLDYFDPDKVRPAGQQTRGQFRIPPEATVIGAVMRLVGDKGTNELVAAFASLADRWPNLYLFLVGPREPNDAPRPETIALMENHPRIIEAGHQRDIGPFYAAMDIFALPTYREGFSAVTLEAQAMKVPVVTTDAVGAGETIVNEETGLVVPVRSTEGLAQALERLVADPSLRQRMGQAGRARIQACFEQKVFWEAVRQHREGLLVARGKFVRREDRLARR